jgi:hypothetical protein
MHGLLQQLLIKNVDFLKYYYYFYKKKIDMGRYSLKLRSGEIIHTIMAESMDDAIEKFCFKKKFDRKSLLDLFVVIKEN